MNKPDQLSNLDKSCHGDDESHFVFSGGSNLAAIFGLQSNQFTDSQSNKQTTSKKNNIQYTSSNDTQQAAPSKTEVLIVKAVHVYKLQNGTYNSMGKLGMALTGNVTKRMYQIILYRNRQEYISVATVTPDFVYNVQTSNCASYHDNNKDNWSVLFENNDSYLEFTIEIGLARYFAESEKRENVIHQDLTQSNEDLTAKEGDNVLIKYFVENDIVQPLKANPVMSQKMIVEISVDNSWERILLGSSKGLMKILFLPPSKQISLGPGFPKEKDVMMIIEIADIQTPKKLLVCKRSMNRKAAIISGMNKICQSILPKISLSSTDSEDTEDDMPQVCHKSCQQIYHKRVKQSEVASQKNSKEESSSSLSLKEEKKPTQKNLEPKIEVPAVDPMYRPLMAATPLTPWTPYFTGHYLTMDNQFSYSVPQTINRAVPPIAVDPGVNTLLSETRLANAEIRMGMSKISDNIQKLVDKFHALEVQKSAVSTVNDKTATEASWKMFSTYNADQAETYNEISKNIEKDLYDKKIREIQNRISDLENNLKISSEEKELLLQVNRDLNKKLQELEMKLASVNNELRKTQENLEIAQGIIKQCKKEKMILEDRLSKCEYTSNDHSCQVDTVDAVSKQTDVKKKNKEIKEIITRATCTISERLASRILF